MRSIITFIAVFFFFNNSIAQTKSYNAQRIDTPPRIDGILDEQIWQDGDWGSAKGLKRSR